MDKANLPYKSKTAMLAESLLSCDLALGFTYAVPTVLLSRAQEWNDRPDTNEWNWYIGWGYQLWDTKDAKPIYVLARDEEEAEDLFYGIFDPTLEYVNQLPCGTATDYDPETTDDTIEFVYHSPFNGTPFDFMYDFEKKAEEQYGESQPSRPL